MSPVRNLIIQFNLFVLLIFFLLFLPLQSFSYPDKRAAEEKQYAQAPPAQTPPMYYSGGDVSAIQPVTGGIEGRISLDLRNIDAVSYTHLTLPTKA